MPAVGTPRLLVDNKAMINVQLATYNCALGWPGDSCGGNADSGGTGSDSSGGDSTTTVAADAAPMGPMGPMGPMAWRWCP